eukprot:47829-Chlamydomonas_euryale.AAC.1
MHARHRTTPPPPDPCASLQHRPREAAMHARHRAILSDPACAAPRGLPGAHLPALNIRNSSLPVVHGGFGGKAEGASAPSMRPGCSLDALLMLPPRHPQHTAHY